MLQSEMHALRRVLLPVLFVAVLLTPSFRGEQLPAQISDDAFWNFVTEASEPGGAFLSENLVSNELGYPYVLQPLLDRVKPGRGAYIGVGPEQNFTYVATLHPTIAFVVDIRRQNMVEHLLYKAIFEMSADRQQFLSRLFARKPRADVLKNATVAELFDAFASVSEDVELQRQNIDAIRKVLLEEHDFELNEEDQAVLEHVYKEFSKNGADTQYAVSNAALRRVQFPQGIVVVRDPVNGAPIDPVSLQELNGNAVALLLGMPFPTYAEVMKATDASGRYWSYLATEDKYQKVRAMQQKNLILPLVGDFAGPKALRAVGKFLKDHDEVVSAFYVSNVEQYLTPAPRLREFYGNVEALPLDSSSTFIRTAQISGPQPGLAQSSLSSILTTLEAVLGGRVRNWNDILLLPQ